MDYDQCPTSSSYFPLAIGNYWVYEITNYDYNIFSGVVFDQKDTMRVLGDTLIRNHTYFAIESDARWYTPFQTVKETSYYRDSAGYIVNSLGNVKFSATDLDNTLFIWELQPTDYYIEYSVQDSIIQQFTPAGLFDCLDFKGVPYTPNRQDRSVHNCYSAGVGLIYETSIYASGSTNVEFRRALYDYHLEE